MSSVDLSDRSLRTGPYILAGLLVVAVMFGGVGTWAALASLTGAVIAPGIVSVDSNRKTIQHLQGGSVAEILVRDGDFVEAGALLVRLDDTQARAKLTMFDSRLDILRARQDRLLAEQQGAADIEFTSAANQGPMQNSNFEEIVKSQKSIFDARRLALQGQTDIQNQRISQLREQIRGLHALRDSKGRQVAIIQDELKGLRELFAQGFAPRTRILALERTAEQLEGERSQHLTEVARAQEGISEAELQIIQLRKGFIETVVKEVQDVQTEIFSLAQEQIAARDVLDHIEIRAPLAGVVVGLDVHTVGGVVAAGQTILNIVPEGDKLVVESRMRPEDIDKVAPGQAAFLRFSAFNLRTTPELTGSVVTVSADRLVDTRTGESYYSARIEIPDRELEKIGTLRLIPGMPVEVFIQTSERTALSYLMKPLRDGLVRTFRE
jgi:HlyD family type I secretion membrane fusion protein